MKPHRCCAVAVGALVALGLGLAAPPAGAAELWIGAATVDITPDRPVALDGHRNLRVSRKVESPLTATALALESREAGKPLEQAILVSCDIVAIREGVLAKVREKLKPRLPDFDPRKLLLCATHTHNAPLTVEGRYAMPEDGIMKPAEYVEFMTERVAEAAVASWQKRQAGKVGWGQGQAAVAQNRRALYADGSAAMYGATNTPKFRGIEGHEDHSLDALFFFDGQERLTATAINIACPAQEAEGGTSIHADFWHPARQALRQQHGDALCILGLTGAGGDQTSRPMFGKAADERMRKLRGLTRLEEVARRIVTAWDDVYAVARKDLRQDVAGRREGRATGRAQAEVVARPLLGRRAAAGLSRRGRLPC